MFKNVSIAEAKAHLSVCVREAEQGDSILITRHGKPVAALVVATHLAELERLRKAGPRSGTSSIWLTERIDDLQTGFLEVTPIASGDCEAVHERGCGD